MADSATSPPTVLSVRRGDENRRWKGENSQGESDWTSPATRNPDPFSSRLPSRFGKLVVRLVPSTAQTHAHGAHGEGSRRGSRRPSGSHPASRERVRAPLWRQRAGEGCAAPLLSDFWDLGPRFPHLSLFSSFATNRPGSAGVCRWRWGQSRFDRDRLNRWDRSSSLRPPRASLKQKPSRRLSVARRHPSSSEPSRTTGAQTAGSLTAL